LRIIGSHPQISKGDIRRLVAGVLEQARDDAVGESTVRLLSGGYSGSLVALVWPEHLEPIVVKAGPEDEIKVEHENRTTFGGADSWLREHHLDGVYGPVEVELDDRTSLWSALTDRYIGGKTFEELEHFSDFEAFVRSYLWNEDRDRAPSSDTLRECLRTVANTLADPRAPRQTAVPRPLIEYLPPLKWENGILAALNTARAFCPDLPELVGFREWWDESIAAIRVAPVPDDRALHGDFRFANILVDSVHSQIHLIDFGNGRRGHAFEDFARFEIDLLFRTTPKVPDHGAIDHSKLLEAVDHLLDDDLNLGDIPNTGRQLACLGLWRQIMYQSFPSLTSRGAPMMYRWFLLCECLKRTRWVASDDEVDSASLIYTICALRQYLSGKGVTSGWMSTAPQVLAAALHCRAAFVPTRGSERIVNGKRNDAKKKALAGTENRISTVRLLAETGQSYLSSRGIFNPQVSNLLATGSSLQVVICNPELPDYLGLSESYEPHNGDTYTVSGDLLSKTQDSLRGYRSLREEFGSLIELRYSRFGVGATILLTNETAFYEPYFRAPRSRRQKLLFDSFELQFDASGLHSRSLLEETFNFHWRHADGVDGVESNLQEYQELKNAFVRLWERGHGNGSVG
jgi:uncharacterized protein Usg